MRQQANTSPKAKECLPKSLLPNCEAPSAPGDTDGDWYRAGDHRRLHLVHGRQRLVAILVATEVAMTLMLLIATGLMVKSANQLWRVDPGFDTRDLLTMTISLPNNKFEWRHNVAFSRDVMRSLQAMPEVRDAAVIQGVPMHAGSFGRNVIRMLKSSTFQS